MGMQRLNLDRVDHLWRLVLFAEAARVVWLCGHLACGLAQLSPAPILMQTAQTSIKEQHSKTQNVLPQVIDRAARSV